MIILDTHAWLWWTNESTKLSSNAKEAIKEATLIGIPAICCWEIAMLVDKSRIGLSMGVEVWFELALKHPKVNLLPLTPAIATLSAQMVNFSPLQAQKLVQDMLEQVQDVTEQIAEKLPTNFPMHVSEPTLQGMNILAHQALGKIVSLQDQICWQQLSRFICHS